MISTFSRGYLIDKEGEGENMKVIPQKIYEFITKKYIVAMFMLIFMISAIISSTYTWQDYSQHKTNELSGEYLAEEEPEWGSLTIKKTVKNKGGQRLSEKQKDTEFRFVVNFYKIEDGNTVIDTECEYEYKIVTDDTSSETKAIKSGDIAKLKHGQKAVIKGMPIGKFYHVTEIGEDGYIISSNNNSGNLPYGGITAGFTNTYGTPEGETKLIVKKIVEGSIPERDEDKKFEFTLTLNEGESNEQIEEFELADGETWEITVPAGTEYSLFEKDYTADGYMQTAVSNGSGIAHNTELLITKTNTYTRNAKINITGEKTWDISEAPTGTVLPSQITINVKKGDEIKGTVTVTPNQEGKWEYTFENLPKYETDDMTEVVYTVEEVPITGYISKVTGYDIKNTWTKKPDIFVKVTKVWKGDKLKDRPSKVEVQLYGDGEAVGNKVTLNSRNNWTYTWTKLDSNTTWTVDEPKVPKGYKKTISGNVKKGFTITNSKGTVPIEQIIIKGKKTWDHGKLDKKHQPKSIVVLVKNGNKTVIQKKVTAKDNWKWSFALDKYDSKGKKIKYTIDEQNIKGYSKKVTGYNIKNTYSSSSYPDDDPSDTGDNSNSTLWLITMLLSGAISITLFILRRKYKKNMV